MQTFFNEYTVSHLIHKFCMHGFDQLKTVFSISNWESIDAELIVYIVLCHFI